MRDVGDGLYGSGIELAGQLIDEKCQDDRHGESEEQGQKTYPQRIHQDSLEVIIGEEVPKMLKPHPLAAQKSSAWLIILKGNHQAEHRPVLEHHIVYEYRNEQCIQRFVLLPISLQFC